MDASALVADEILEVGGASRASPDYCKVVFVQVKITQISAIKAHGVFVFELAS